MCLIPHLNSILIKGIALILACPDKYAHIWKSKRESRISKISEKLADYEITGRWGFFSEFEPYILMALDTFFTV